MKIHRYVGLLGLLIAMQPVRAEMAPGFQSIGPVKSVERTTSGLVLTCTDGATVQLTILATDLVRVRTLFAGQKEPQIDHSWAIERTQWAPVDWQLREEKSQVIVTTAELEILIQRSPLLVQFRDSVTHTPLNADQRPMARDPSTGRIAAAKRLGFDEHFYGLGEKAARLDHRRGTFEMWNSDTPGYVEGTDPIYQSIPFYIGWENGNAYGLFFDNSYRSTFDFGHTGQEAVEYQAAAGELNYYFFCGPSMKKILGRYADLTGHMPLPPLWALGNQQSRYSYYPAAMADEIVEQYRQHDLPLDVLYLDIHYMNGYRVFTWDPERFPDPSELTRKLGGQGVKVVTIVDPGVKFQSPVADSHDAATSPDQGPQNSSYYVYNQGLAHDYFLHREDGSLYIGEVWPGKAVFVDYTKEDARRWWGDLHRALVDRGVAGVWTDMNEPSDFVDKSGATQKDVIFDDLGTHTPYAKNRNVFALNMARATYEGLERLRPEQRPFVITRAGYAGVQRYATMWTGDNNATFESLALNLPMFASLGLSGEPFVGADLPGFIGRGNGELLARSYEVAFLAPLCRNHGVIDDYDHEPWRYGVPYETIVRKYLKLRYQLLPFLYTTLEEAHRTGVPLFRPLLLNFQHDVSTLNLDDEFMVGDALLAAPVVHAGERSRDVYLPQGLWYNFWTSATIKGLGELHHLDVPLDHVPLFVRGGSIVPSTQSMNYVGERPWDPLRFDIYPDDTGAAIGSLYEDDGVSPAYKTGTFRRTTVRYQANAADNRIELETPAGSYQSGKRKIEFALHAATTPTTVLLDGQPLSTSTAVTTTHAVGWFREKENIIVVRLEDDGRKHVVQFR